MFLWFFMLCFFFFKQKTAYEMRISDWSSDVCSSDLSIPIGDPPDDGANASELAPRKKFAAAFDALVGAGAGGYAFLEGAHGIGNRDQPRDITMHCPPE